MLFILPHIDFHTPMPIHQVSQKIQITLRFGRGKLISSESRRTAINSSKFTNYSGCAYILRYTINKLLKEFQIEFELLKALFVFMRIQDIDEQRWIVVWIVECQIYGEEITHSVWRAALTMGRPATMEASMPHSLVPLLILKNPLSPQSSFQELATSQQSAPPSVPQPRILMAWPPRADPLTWWQTPLLQARKSLQTVKAASTGPWVWISVWILATLLGTEQTLEALWMSSAQGVLQDDWQDFTHLGVAESPLQLGYFPETWWSQGGSEYGWHQLEVLQSQPVTRPVFLKQDQAASGQPPLQPWPQLKPQQVSRFWAEILVWTFCPLAMQTLSLMASAAPKAQQDPQLDWSRTSLMDSQLGQAVRESKSSLMFSAGMMSFWGSLASLGVSRTPIKPLISSMVLPSQQWLWPAFQLTPLRAFTSSMIAC